MTDSVTKAAQAVESAAVAASRQASTTFGDLFFGSFDSPWALVGVAVASALLGMFSHWIKKFYTEYETENIFRWFLVKNRRGTILAVVSLLGALFAVFAPLDYTTMTSYQVFTQAWAIGYAADSVFNSNTPQRFRRRKTMQAEAEASELPSQEASSTLPVTNQQS